MKARQAHYDRHGKLYYSHDNYRAWNTTTGAILATRPLVDPMTCEIIARANEILTDEQYTRCCALSPIGPDGSDWHSNVVSVWVLAV